MAASIHAVSPVSISGLREDHASTTGVTALSSVSPVRMRTTRSSGDDEDLAVADLAGPGALAERLDRRLDERVGDGDLEADLLGEPHLHGRAAVGLDPVELTPVALDAAHRDAAHLGAVSASSTSFAFSGRTMPITSFTRRLPQLNHGGGFCVEPGPGRPCPIVQEVRPEFLRVSRSPAGGRPRSRRRPPRACRRRPRPAPSPQSIVSRSSSACRRPGRR